MQFVYHPAQSRGHANHGWLNSFHTFSFAGYHNPERMNFGVLRVLNDDTIAGGTGFGTHPHENMEIISIPLSGDLEHQDSMGNTAVIREGEIQVMSAGSGVFHSEYNKNKDKEAKFLQIWLFPNQRNVTPRYEQMRISLDTQNEWIPLISPNSSDEGLWIHQNAWFQLANLESGQELNYSLHDSENGVYVFIISGSIQVNHQELNERDGFGVWDTGQLRFKASTHARVLVMEVPMKI